MPNRVSENINLAIMDNELQATDWELNNLVWELTWFVDFFNIAFFADEPVPMPALTFERTRVTNLGYYRIGLNDFAVRNQINLNRLYIDRPLFETLQTLLHEMVHAWEHIYVPEEKRTKNWYHTRAFREKLASMGIITNEKGCHMAVGDPFTFLLRKHGVIPDHKPDKGGLIILPPPPAKKGKSKLKLWECGCGQKVRVGKKNFFAKCTLCGEEFQRNDN